MQRLSDNRSKIALRPFTMWRYQEFLSLDMGPSDGSRSARVIRTAASDGDVLGIFRDRMFWGATAASVVIGLSLLAGLVMLVLKLWW